MVMVIDDEDEVEFYNILKTHGYSTDKDEFFFKKKISIVLFTKKILKGWFFHPSTEVTVWRASNNKKEKYVDDKALPWLQYFENDLINNKKFD